MTISIQFAENRMLDRNGREIDYLRISVTDRCNLRCKYCMPDGIQSLPMSEILTYEEMCTIAETAAELMRTRTLAARHGPPGISGRATGSMLENTGAGEYVPFLGGGRRDVYSMGYDSRGTRNALKAYVLNYGRGKSLRGDRFITGKKKETEEAVQQAMAQEASAALKEATGG